MHAFDSNPNPLLQLLADQLLKNADAPFLVHMQSGKQLSYRELWETAAKLTVLLDHYKIEKKSRLAFAVRNHWLVYPLLIACSARRATLVPLDPDLHRDELAFILDDCQPTLTIHLDGIELPKQSGQPVRLALNQLLSALDALAESPQLGGGEADDVNLMIYTSGTTGTNKCVMLSGGNLAANARSLAARYQIRADDRFWCTLPTHHMNAIMITGLLPMAAGASVYLSDVLSFKNAKTYWKNLDDHRISVCSLVPSIMALLLRLFPKGKDAAGPHLRFGFCGAAPLSASIWQDFERTFACPIYQGYGLTETTCWAVSIPPEGPRKWDSVGIPLDCCHIKIDDSELGEVESFLFTSPETSTPKSGEILIKGPIVSPGYFKNPKLNKQTMSKDGYFKTGDLGYFDEDGFLHISGRIKEIIIKNGSNVFSRDIDQVLIKHPAVKECKTIGIPDDLVGERIYSIFVEEDHDRTDAATIKAWLQAQISTSMWPDMVLKMGYIPAGAAGKISINMLKKIVTGELTQEIMSSLNRVRYKRAQPSGPEQMSKLIQKSLKWGIPIPFLAYWGCGTRDDFSDYDRLTLNRLKEYLDGAKRVAQAAPELTIIFTDTHAQNNAIPADRMNRYFAGVRSYAEKLGMKSILMSEIWAITGLRQEQITARIESADFNAKWQAEALRPRLIEQASKHVEQNQSVEQAAMRYYAITALEGEAVARLYADAIFTSFNHPDFDCVSPGLPKLYLSSYKEGTSVKPWFI